MWTDALTQEMEMHNYMKELLVELVKPIGILYRHSFSTHTWPFKWKKDVSAGRVRVASISARACADAQPCIGTVSEGLHLTIFIRYITIQA